MTVLVICTFQTNHAKQPCYVSSDSISDCKKPECPILKNTFRRFRHWSLGMDR